MVLPTRLNGKRGNCSIPTELTEDDFAPEVYVPGSLVWAKHTIWPWWPAMVEDDPDEEIYFKEYEKDENNVAPPAEYHVVFFTDKPQKVRRAWMSANNLMSYVDPPIRIPESKKGKYSSALQESKRIADTAKPMPIGERLQKFSFARLSNLKTPVVKKDKKVRKIPVKKNGKGGRVSAIPNKRRRHASAAVGTVNGAVTTVSKIVHTAADAAGVLDIAVSEIGCNVEIATTVPEVSDTNEIFAETSSPQTAAVNAVSSEIVTVAQTSNLPSTTDTIQPLNSVNEELNSEEADIAAFDKELEKYASSDDESPVFPDDNTPLPEDLRGKKIHELFSDVMSDSSDEGSCDGVAPYRMEFDSDNEPSQVTATEMPVLEKYVLTSEDDIWDINNPNLKSTAYLLRMSKINH